MKDIAKHFSEEALEVIRAACDQAHENGRKVCTTAQLLLIILRSPIAQELLTQKQVHFQQIQKELEEINKQHTHPHSLKRGKVIFSPDLRETLHRAYLIAKETKVQFVGIEDLLVAGLYQTEIEQMLKRLQFNLPALEDLIISIRGGKPEDRQKTVSIIAKYTINLTNKAKSNELEEIVDREREYGQIARILTRKTKNNVVLQGENGVGRTSIVHLLAQKIASGQIIQQLADAQILQLNISGLLSAIASRNISELGEIFEEELRQMGNVILFIPNFENLIDENSIEKNFVANMLKSLMNSGSNRFILTMTASGYRKITAKESAMMEKFATIKVDEPSIEETIRILNTVIQRLSKYHNISFNPEVIELSAKLSKRYIQDQFLPSKAIDILDEASSKVSLENRDTVTIDDIKTVIAEKTGIPIEKLTVSEQKKLTDLEETLNQTVIGQKEAVHVVSEVIRRSRAGLKDPKKPIGSFLFLGPSGVGKTYLAKNLTRIVYDNENAMTRIDMSEFSESHTVQRLIGSPPGYVGYEEGGQLTNPIWERPYSLILLDEIEKAHAKVFDIFLQVLDEGRLTDGQGRTVDFKNTIIIATSNIASDKILDKLQKKERRFLKGFEREKFYEQEILPLLKDHFRPEFINRFDEIVAFNPLGIEELKVIGKLQIQKVQNRLHDKKITLQVSEEKLSQFAEKAHNPAFGARPLIRLIQEEVENVIARKIISGEIKEGDTVTI